MPHKGQKWKVGALLEDKKFGSCMVLDYRRKNDGTREYKVVQSGWATSRRLHSGSKEWWAPEERLREQPQ